MGVYSSYEPCRISLLQIYSVQQILDQVDKYPLEISRNFFVAKSKTVAFQPSAQLPSIGKVRSLIFLFDFVSTLTL